MKHLDFHYHLKITMDAPVDQHHFVLRCVPGTDRRQKISLLQQFISPADFISESADQWGNKLLYGSCFSPHTDFKANVCGHAEVESLNVISGDSNDFIFRYPTVLTEACNAIRHLSSQINSKDEYQLAYMIMNAVYESLAYIPDSTDVTTTASQAFHLGAGVCQDYAHLMIAMLRDKGIPTRYVTGMLLGEGKSHAWVEALIDNYWISFDPTHNALADDNYIKLSHGRDATDCSINRGVFRGYAKQTSEISVIVKEV